MAKGITADKAAQLRGPPVEKVSGTVEHFDELLKTIERLAGPAIKRVSPIDGEAVELPSAEPSDGAKQNSDSA